MNRSRVKYVLSATVILLFAQAVLGTSVGSGLRHTLPADTLLVRRSDTPAVPSAPPAGDETAPAASPDGSADDGPAAEALPSSDNPRQRRMQERA
ncbi:hypothetical protein, partial [uncultured Alistipes sp.]|uniref:hypothetical protein n=1 Tax=uncultured Alistipes sp. TaxID=538949 RepID=UPI0026135446